MVHVRNTSRPPHHASEHHGTGGGPAGRRVSWGRVARGVALVLSALTHVDVPAAEPPAPDPYALTCLPSEVGGTGVGLQVRTNAFGVTRWHYCNDGFSWRYTFEAYPWQMIYNPANWALFNSVKASLPAASAAAATNLTLDLNSATMLPVWKHWHAEMAGSAPASLWVVSRSGSALERSAFKLKPDGSRDPAPAGKTPIIKNGARVACDMKIRVLEWPLYFGRISTNPDLITVCERR